MNPINVLIIDDEEDMRNLVQMYLENSGFKCAHASDGVEGLIKLHEQEFDLVILDIMMPFEDGFAVCGKIRTFSQVPIIFLSAKGEEWDKVRGLQLGGDDYIVKPFSPGELVARINALLRRTSFVKNDEDTVTLGKINIDKKGRRVSVEGEIIPLTLKEFELLVFLVQHQGQALSREQLLEFVWGMDYHGSLRTVDTHIKTLRMKLGTGDYIQTIWGVGYKFEVPAT
ncbi:response regulator transcription factor [Mesobacillus selenatarsenatis]|uniref:Two-component response regulator n=1 Tax=Mesobacillus selenatarsenatis (strain DSM 18680 / JCM 14380 / FERM P-15431 / SF-1) TaxID=1321606 RepID=A0A0A8X9V2_MESS1|nr:response regulator transcription factor [Mesobacillus selenatarsenatis]GAM16745.1 two-component response regulator [Mesobacillus selenatarsenatis SF-1]